MHKLDANELFGTTLYTFNRIMEVWWKNWPDAFALYFRLMQQARIQQTNQTLSNNQFLMKAMGRGQDRLTKANKILKELWLIDRVQATRWGKIVGVYVRVNFLIDEDKVRTSYTTYNINLDEIWVQDEEVSWIGENLIQEKLDSGKTITNAWSIKDINAWSIKEKELLLHKDSKAEILEETPLLSIDIEEEKEKSSAKKEKEVVYNEYDFVDEFIDKNNWTIQYLLNKDKDYIKKQSKYVDKLIKQWYDIETIKTVLNFIKQDDFWRKNILSVEKLLRKNKDWVPYIVVMIEKIKQYRPKAIDLDSLYINN